MRDQIETIQAEFPFYGYRRIHHHLERLKGLTVNEKKIIRIMRECGFKSSHLERVQGEDHRLKSLIWLCAQFTSWKAPSTGSTRSGLRT